MLASPGALLYVNVTKIYANSKVQHKHIHQHGHTHPHTSTQHTHAGKLETSLTWTWGEGKQWGHCFCSRWSTRVMNMLNTEIQKRHAFWPSATCLSNLTCAYILMFPLISVQYGSRAAPAAFPLISHDFMFYFIRTDFCHNHLKCSCLSLSTAMTLCHSSKI